MTNEVEIVNAVLRGDSEAFRFLVEAYQQSVYMLALSTVHDRCQAQDLTQDALIRAYVNLEKLREPVKFGAWLHGIARNVTGRWLERHHRHESLESLLEQGWLQPEMGTLPFDEVPHIQQMREWLWYGIYSLPETSREALLLFYVRGMSRKDAANCLGISEAAMRNRLHKARKLLKEVLMRTSEEASQGINLPEDFTDRVMVEAMEQGEAYLQERNWEKAKQAFLRAVDAQEDHAPAYRGIGLAAQGEVLAQLRTPGYVYDRKLLEEAVEELGRAFRLGDRTPETVWPLTEALQHISDLDRSIRVLKEYADNAPDATEEFLALHYIVGKYSLLHEHKEAVKWHKDMLEKMQSKMPAERLLWSLSTTIMMGSWKKCGLLSEWMSISHELYSQMEDTYDTCTSRAYYLRSLIEAVYVPAERFEEALETCERLKALTEKYIEQWVEARWIFIDAQANLLLVYHATNRGDMEAQTVVEGKQYVSDYGHWVTQLSTSGGDREVTYKDPVRGKADVRSLYNFHRQYYQFSLHDFACVCMWTGHYEDAVELFEKALAIMDVPNTHFFLAGSILKATGDREKSFQHFRQAVENPLYSPRHNLKQVVLGDSSFEDVWDDDQFLSLIEKEAQKDSQQVEK